MSELDPSALDDFKNDIEQMVSDLQEAFDSDKSRYYYDDQQEILFVELSGVDQLDEDEIEATAEPVLNSYDLDLDEVYILPLN